MIEILDNKFIMICQQCWCVFTYEQEDIHDCNLTAVKDHVITHHQYITCPKCGTVSKINKKGRF